MVAAGLLQYLKLPLRAAPLLLIGVMGVLLSLAEHAGLLGVPALVILCYWFVSYGFALLDHVVEGRPDAPVFSYEMAHVLTPRPLGSLLLVLAFYFSTEALRPWIGGMAVSIVRLFLLALAPAMIAAMSLTGRFIDALHPAAVFGIIVRIPLVYGMLLLGLAAAWFLAVRVLQASAGFFSSLWRADTLLPGELSNAIGFEGSLIGVFEQMILLYLWLTTFACIGGSIYEQRLELGIDVAASPELKAARARKDLERQRDTVWDRVFGQVRIGAFAAARESVRQLLAESRQPLEECRWLYARAADKTDQRFANYLAQLTLPRLIDARATGEAVELVRERLTRAPDFRPQRSAELLTLARLARDAGDRRTARALLADFDKHYTKDPMQSVAAQLQAELER